MKTNTTLIIALIAMLTIGFAAAGTDMSIYDRNEDGMIDADERTVLDIDIENSRISPAEARVIDSYTTDGTIILNEEFQSAFLNPSARPRDTVTEVTVVEDPAPVVEETAVPTQTAVPTPAAEPETVAAPVDEDVGGNLTLFMIIALMVVGGVIIYVYSSRNKKE